MPVTQWDVKWYEATIEQVTNSIFKVNLERALNENDTIQKGKYLASVVSITGYSPTDKAGYFKFLFNATASAVDDRTQNPVLIRLPIKVLDDKGNLITQYDRKIDGEAIEVTNYPTPFSQYGETDTFVLVAGPITPDVLYQYDPQSVSADVIMYQADEQTPGPTPTSEGGGKNE